MDRRPGRARRGLPADLVQWYSPTRGLVRQTDHYFVGRVPDELRTLGEVAAMHATDGIEASRWWTLAELDATGESVYPTAWRPWSGQPSPSSSREGHRYGFLPASS